MAEHTPTWHELIRALEADRHAYDAGMSTHRQRVRRPLDMQGMTTAETAQFEQRLSDNLVAALVKRRRARLAHERAQHQRKSDMS